MTVGISPNKTNRRDIKHLSLNMIEELQVGLELSDNGTKLLCSTLRKGLGKQKAVESRNPETYNTIKKNLEDLFVDEQVLVNLYLMLIIT